MRKLIFFLLLALPSVFAQEHSPIPVTLGTATGTIEGTLLRPPTDRPIPVVLLISGSGPTDRNGRNPLISPDSAKQSNFFRLLAQALAERGVATLRYDKRGVAGSREAGPDEGALRFDHYVADAEGWVRYLKKDKKWGKVMVLGHSEGSLVGMVAAQRAKADAFISLAGAGRPADKIIRQQLQTQPQTVRDQVYPVLDSLVQGKTVEKVNPMFGALFRPSVQPYLISWFKYDPRAEIKKLSVPVLIVQGTADLQVNVEDAKRLAAANQGSRLVLIPAMNHVLKEAPTEQQANLATYSNPYLPVVPQCIEEIARFVLSVK